MDNIFKKNLEKIIYSFSNQKTRIASAAMIIIRIRKQNELYPQISSVEQTPAVLEGNALVAIGNKARITMAPFKAYFRACELAHKASAGLDARVATELIATVWRTGSSYKKREGRKTRLGGSANVLLCGTHGTKICSSMAQFSLLPPDMPAHKP